MESIRTIKPLYRFLMRFRYPGSLPEDVAHDLAIPISAFLPFSSFIESLINSIHYNKKLVRYMTRESAEAIFLHAQKKECFSQNTLLSYYFNEGWLEFVLFFDDQSRLRRAYIQHQFLGLERVEINLYNA